MRTWPAIALGISLAAPGPRVAAGASARMGVTVQVVRSARVVAPAALVDPRVLARARSSGALVVDPRGAPLPVAVPLPAGERSPGVVWITVLTDG